MQRLWSPWRSQFIESVDEESDDGASPFTRAFAEPERDEENYLLYRGDRAFIILNRYPYNAGHLLVVPVRQTGEFLELTADERREMIDLVEYGIRLLKRALAPHAFNVGMNLGRSAGAAIDRHVHMHIVPRWNGDTNFLPVLDETRHVSEYMHATYRKLIDARRELEG